MNLSNHFQQSCEVNDVCTFFLFQSSLIVFPGAPFIRVHVLTEQRHLTKSSRKEILSFRDDRMLVAASLTSACEGHHAKRTHVVATSHDRDKSRYSIRVQSNGRDVGICLFP